MLFILHFLPWGQSLLSNIWGELGSCMGFFNLCQPAGTLFQPRITFLVVQVGFAPRVQPAPGAVATGYNVEHLHLLILNGAWQPTTN